MYTLSSDESVGMAKEKSVSWPQKLDTCYTKRLPRGGSRRGGGGEQKSHIMRRIQLDDLRSRDRGIKLVYSTRGMLNRYTCIINGLTVPHCRVFFQKYYYDYYYYYCYYDDY